MRLLKDEASEELKQERANKGKNWNDVYKTYQDKKAVPTGGEFEVLLPKAKVLVSGMLTSLHGYSRSQPKGISRCAQEVKCARQVDARHGCIQNGLCCLLLLSLLSPAQRYSSLAQDLSRP